jgi:hypothetical protein
MKKYIFLLCFLATLISKVSAQEVKLAQDVGSDTLKSKFGPNLKHYVHAYVGYGLVAGPSEAKGSQVKYPSSHEWVFGVRYKYKIGEVYGLGLDLALTPQVFALKQQEGKLLPNTVHHDSEKLKFTNIGLGFYNRFNFDKRGNYMGTFLDLGVYGNWMAHSAHVFQDPDSYPLSGVKNIKVQENDLKYLANFNYGALVRLGFNNYVFYGTYRISDLFDSGYGVFDLNGKNVFDFPELPRYTIGFQFSLHK